jgi:hypothetical protein
VWFYQIKRGRRILGEESEDIHDENKMKENTSRMLIKQTESCQLAGSLAEPEHRQKESLIEEPAQIYRRFDMQTSVLGRVGEEEESRDEL